MKKKDWEILQRHGVTPDNLTVGYSLDLKGTQITSLPDNLTVGYSLDLEGTQITDTSMVNHKIDILSWSEGKYIKVDGLFTEVIHKRGNVWKVRKPNGTKDFYLITDGNGKYAHGDTLKEARMDLMFKVSNRDKSDFEHLTIGSELSFQEAIESYRVITGACSAGVKDFIQSNDIKEKSYKVSEIIQLTSNSYGGSNYKAFFNK